MTLAKVNGISLNVIDNIGSMAIARIMLRERLLKFRELELISISNYNEATKSFIDKNLEEIHSLMFPWAAEEQSKKKEKEITDLREKFKRIKSSEGSKNG